MFHSRTYDAHYYADMERTEGATAKIIADLIVKEFHPKDAVDVGCGTGLMVRELRARGVDAIGVDGKWVEDKLVFPRQYFIPVNIEQETIPIKRKEKFDVAVCMEVAEHLDPNSATKLVRDLANLSNVVVWTAGMPYGQDPTHKNEQWQSYWAERFGKLGYYPSDYFRNRLWNDKRVVVWNKQTMVLYIRRGSRFAGKYKEAEILDVIHPEQFMQLIIPDRVYAKLAIGAFFSLPKRFIKKIMKKR